MKAYMLSDKQENIFLGVVKAPDLGKAKTIVAKSWMYEWELGFIETCNLINCSRCPDLDDYDFEYLDGRNMKEEYDKMTIEDIKKELDKCYKR